MEPLIQKLGITKEEAKEISLKEAIAQRIFLEGYGDRYTWEEKGYDQTFYNQYGDSKYHDYHDRANYGDHNDSRK